LPHQPLLLGHRGARLYAPENTVAAFDLALQHGADGFEFDVRCTGHQETVICHDPRLNRLVVRKHTLRQLRASCPAGAEPVPSLEEILERYSRAAFLNIEIKVRGMEELVVRALKRAPPRRYFISSFLRSAIRALHALDSSLVLGLLADSRRELLGWHKLPVAYVVPHYSLLSERLVRKLHDAGKKVVTWTVNDLRGMRRAAELGVDGIISDDTKLLVETFKAQ
jgi:glycerophosphoryl diester phosphodiesterase